VSEMRRTALALCLLASCSGAAEESSGERAAAGCQGVGCRLEALARDSEQREPWRLHETRSFRVFHYDEPLAARLASEAEAQRLRQLREWLGRPQIDPWVPRCDVYLYPSTRLLVRLSDGRPKAGQAFSAPSRLYRGGVVRRRIDLAADDRDLFTHTLPHEISHVVLEALLAQRVPAGAEPPRVPLWAHEGTATLEEPAARQQSARALVATELAARRTYPVRTLMEMPRYPDREYVRLFYAQSYSLVRFFVEDRGRPAFLAFVRRARPGLVEAALRQSFGWDFSELQRRWEASAGAP
jgi:hypothetical protein